MSHRLHGEVEVIWLGLLEQKLGQLDFCVKISIMGVCATHIAYATDISDIDQASLFHLILISLSFTLIS